MFERSGEPGPVIIKGLKEKLGEPIDYPTLILSKVYTALSHPVGSTHRDAELNDLEDTLAPFFDDEYAKEKKKLEAEKAKWRSGDGRGDWNVYYHRVYYRNLMKLLKRQDVLTIGRA